LLKENWHLFSEEPKAIAKPPERFLDFEEVMQALEGLEFDSVNLEGQEASLDPQYAQLTEALHKRFGSQNTLCTNAYTIPPLKDTDNIQVSLKAINDGLHYHYTGKSNKRVLKNFVNLYQSGMKLTVSSVLIPGYIDADETERIAQFIGSVDKDIPYHILAYFKSGKNPWRRPKPDEMDEAEVMARRHLNKVRGWRGDEEIMYEMVRIV
jgi:pyruvate-formate lyase-activating enzyme